MNINDFDVPSLVTKAVGALLILIITWILAKVVKKLVTKGVGRVKVLQRQGADGQSLAESLGAIGSLTVWLFGLIAILNLFALTEVVTPISDLLAGILNVLPGIVGAGLVLFIGIVMAKIARQLVEMALQTAGADNWLKGAVGATDRASAQAGVTQAADSTSQAPAHAAAGDMPKISEIAGQVVFGLIVIVVSISAVQVLGIEAISGPATEMLSQILNALPAILAAAVLLAIGYFIGRLVAPILEVSLRGMGIDRSLADLGVSASGASAPSALISRIVHIAIVLFFAIAATRVLNFPEITQILDTVLGISGRIVLGAAVIAAGVLVANVLAKLVQGQTGTYIKYAAIALFVAIGLRSMGLADSIVNLAFGAVVVGGAAAAALAFGLGGRDAAARKLEELQSNKAADHKASSTPPVG